MKHTSILLLAAGLLLFEAAPTAVAQSQSGVTGFAVYQDLGLQGVSGGGAGTVQHVSTYSDLVKYLKGNTPYVIIVDADITGGGMQGLTDEVTVGSNKTLLGAGSGKALNGICLNSSGQQNIIIRNITLTKGRTDGMSFRNCHHVWIDHCDLSDSYDGLLDFTVGSDYLTCSWTKLHNHNKVSITNSGTCHYEDYGKEHVTFAHCWFDQNTQRNPRIGYGRMHIYNCYWTDISSYCIGFHSQAQVLSEHNYFTSTARNPFCNQYSDVLPYCGYLTDRDSYFASGNPGTSYAHAFTGISYTPTDYYGYSFDLEATSTVKSSTPAQCGPVEGLAYEPILLPGNGAIDVPVTQTLSWGAVDGASASELYFGTDTASLTLTTADQVRLEAATTYYWYVRVQAGGAWHASPLYRFTTADTTPCKPYPADGSSDAWLRWPSASSTFCTTMPLSWRPAFDAASYRVYLGTRADSLALLGQTRTTAFTPSRQLAVGQTYCWRVDAVRADGTVVTGPTWRFSTPARTWTVGKNECESAYLSGIAFRLSGTAYSGGACVRGDQGPGAICGTFSGEAGTYAFSTTYFNQSTGPVLMGLSVNGRLLDAWLTDGTDTKAATRHTRHTARLQTGDELRLEFVAGYADGSLNESYGLIDFLTITAAEGDTVATRRAASAYHAPESTPGYDCEYLTLSSVLFADTLGTVGDKGATQVKDSYCSWITMHADAYSFRLQQTALVKFDYIDASGYINQLSDTLDASAQHTLTASARLDGATLQAIRLYKSLPADTVYHTPLATAGYDCQLLWSPDCIFLDTYGTKGDKGKKQVRDGYDTWMKYTNKSANEVHAKSSSDGIKAYINPTTDLAVTGFVPAGTDGTTYCYVVGTAKYMTLFVEGCRKAKFYYSGTGGAATNLILTVTEAGGASTDYEGGMAKGKNVASSTVEAELDPTRRYTLKVIATTGDMLVYATKLWPADGSAISQPCADVPADSLATGQAFSLTGQAVTSGYRGIVVQGGKLVLRR